MRRKSNSGQRMKLIMTWFIIFLMVGSVFGIIFFGFRSGGTANTGPVQDFGLDFVNRGDHWTTRINDIHVPFSYLPSQVFIIPMTPEAVALLQGKAQIDVTSDFDDVFAEQIALAQFQMRITMETLGTFTRYGYTAQEGHQLQVITCAQATESVPVIYYRQGGNFSRIFAEGNCVIAEAGTSAAPIQLKDRMIYGLTGILQ